MKKILLAIDGSESCNKAINTTVELAEKWAANVTIINVIDESLDSVAFSREQAEEVVEKKKELDQEHEDIVVSCANLFNNDLIEVNEITREGHPAEEICKEADNGDYDLIIVADMGKSSIKKFLLGSTTEKVVRFSNKSVLVVK